MIGKAGWVQARWFLQPHDSSGMVALMLWGFVASCSGVMRPSYMCLIHVGFDVAVVYTGIWC